MAASLTIPDVTEAEELVAYDQHQPHLVDITLHSGPTAVWLFNAAAHGAYVPLVVLTLEGSGIVALDEVVVASGQVSSAASDLMMFSLSANSVRFV